MWKDIKVLIVEDDPDMREILSFSFEMEGAHVFSAGNGKEAMDLIENQNFHFIISDVQMPIVDGVELLQWVKENYKELPMFFLATGFCDLSEDEAIKMGAEKVFNKPFQMDELMSFVADYINKIDV